MSIKTIAVVGASGNLGAPLLDALVDSGHFTVTVIQRASSKSTPSRPVPVKRVQDSFDVSELTSALRGQDACVAAFPLSDLDTHLRLADAAAAAGVKRFVPADFGSVDARSARARELVPLFGDKVEVRKRLEALAAQSDGGDSFTWTSLVPGHYFDWGLKEGFLNFDLKAKKALVFGDGNAKMSNSTLAQVGRAVVQVLLKPEETANRVLLIQSFTVSQMDILRSLEKATGQKWEVEHGDLDEFVKEHKRRSDAGDKASIEELVFALGVIEGSWETRDDFAMELLGLQNEDLDEVVAKVVASA
jgi:putative NADH-flavin reductase